MSASCASCQNSSLLNLERALAIPLLTPGICCRQRSTFFCMSYKTNKWTRTIMDLLLDEHLVMICTMGALSQCTRIPFAPEMVSQIARTMVMPCIPLQLMLMSHPGSRFLGICPDTSGSGSSSQSLHHWHL